MSRKYSQVVSAAYSSAVNVTSSRGSTSSASWGVGVKDDEIEQVMEQAITKYGLDHEKTGLAAAHIKLVAQVRQAADQLQDIRHRCNKASTIGEMLKIYDTLRSLEALLRASVVGDRGAI